jgi:hypothetical protein
LLMSGLLPVLRESGVVGSAGAAGSWINRGEKMPAAIGVVARAADTAMPAIKAAAIRRRLGLLSLFNIRFMMPLVIFSIFMPILPVIFPLIQIDNLVDSGRNGPLYGEDSAHGWFYLQPEGMVGSRQLLGGGILTDAGQVHGNHE